LGKIATNGGGGAIDRERLRARFRLSHDQTPTFEQFLQYVVQSNPRTLNIHWRPATLVCGLNRVQYSHVLPFKEISRSLPWLAAVVHRNASSLNPAVASASKCTESAMNRAGCASASASTTRTPDLHALLSVTSEKLRAFYGSSQLHHLVPLVERLYKEDLAFTGRVGHPWRYAPPTFRPMSPRQHVAGLGGAGDGGRLRSSVSPHEREAEAAYGKLGDVCIGIKHMSQFRHRRQKLRALLDAVLTRAPHAMVMVADDLASKDIVGQRWQAAAWA
jgi:hypothetical protein